MPGVCPCFSDVDAVPQALAVVSSHGAVKCVAVSPRISSRCVSPSLCAGMSWSWELTDAVRTQRREWMLLRSLPADTLLHTSASHLQSHELRLRVCARIGGTYWQSVEVQQINSHRIPVLFYLSYKMSKCFCYKLQKNTSKKYAGGNNRNIDSYFLWILWKRLDQLFNLHSF